MFATFDNSDFPNVKVTLSKTIIDRNDFENFLQEWLKLYDNKQYFTFIFDTQNVGFINPKYSILMSLFIKELKKRDIQYLEKSHIYVYNNFTLSNLWDEVILMHPSGIIIDEVYYDNGITFPDESGKSMMLINSTFDNSMGENWSISSKPQIPPIAFMAPE